MNLHTIPITMWDFSWIERRWSGAGFEDWDKALSELVERGYEAVRIDAFPHLIAKDKDKEWTLLPVWYSNDWGSPYINRVRLHPELIDFIRKCKEYNIKVGLSTWYREDEDDVRMEITSPEKMAENWKAVLDLISDAGLLDQVLYVDLCNEWPGDIWAPYFENDPKDAGWGAWYTEKSMEYMKKAVNKLRESYPEIPMCFSMDNDCVDYYIKNKLDFFDLIEHHIWMVKLNGSEFYRNVGQAKDGRYTEEAYHLLSKNALKVYEEKKEYWQQLLKDGIKDLADASKLQDLPLATTECWGIVDYKDYPLLSWDWVKDLCEIGVNSACDSKRWLMAGTSNFACPQFVGMWRDVEWHKRLTDKMKQTVLPDDLVNEKWRKRLSL